MNEWTKIDYDEALYLLSTYFSANSVYLKHDYPLEVMCKIRNYAANIINGISYRNLELILLQLV